MDSNIFKHCFNPDVPKKYREKYIEVINKINNALPGFRKKILKNEIDYINGNEIDDLKIKSIFLVLFDLLNQGYCYSVEDDLVYLTLSQENAESKDFIRNNMSFEKITQLRSESVKNFIDKMEKKKKRNGINCSIKDLIGDSREIVRRYYKGENKVIDPYVQLVDNSYDILSGFNLKDIWRYFRYTWSIPYKNTPGRNLFYLVRDRAQKYHPIIGIFALGNCILNLTVRDNEIGWTIESVKKNMKRMNNISFVRQAIDKERVANVKKVTYLESETEYLSRISQYSKMMMKIFVKSIDDSINEIYKNDFAFDFNNPTYDMINLLRDEADKLKKVLLDTPHLNEGNVNYETEAQLPLYRKKRCVELAKLLESKIIIKEFYNVDSVVWLNNLLKNEKGLRAINTAIVANRKTKIGSNMMEIIVCGSIPPYNEILGGKLVSILACSPIVARDYKIKYQHQVSEIASRMAGKKIIRDSSLAFLGTTSLYTKCSSQYNRISVPDKNGNVLLKYEKVGITEGFGTLFFSKETTDCLQKMQILNDGGRKINNVFGEGTSPRFRLLSTSFSNIGLKADHFLKHNSPRIVYMMNLAFNTKEFLLGIDEKLNYCYDLSNEVEVLEITQSFIDYWYNRWFLMRISNDEIICRLNLFNSEDIVVSNNR